MVPCLSCARWTVTPAALRLGPARTKRRQHAAPTHPAHTRTCAPMHLLAMLARAATAPCLLWYSSGLGAQVFIAEAKTKKEDALVTYLTKAGSGFLTKRWLHFHSGACQLTSERDGKTDLLLLPCIYPQSQACTSTLPSCPCRWGVSRVLALVWLHLISPCHLPPASHLSYSPTPPFTLVVCQLISTCNSPWKAHSTNCRLSI